jgi:hypothetical protein
MTLTAAVFVVFFGLAPAVSDDRYTQTYVVLINNEIAGTETVTEEKDRSGAETYTSEHELLVNDGLTKNRMVFSTKMVFSRGTRNLRTYACWYKTGQNGNSYDVTVKDGQITRVLTYNGQSVVTAPFKPNMVIVDFNVYYQYEHLIRRYDRKKRGTQVFDNFIPVIGNDIPMRVTLLGNETLRFGENNIEVSRFRVESANINTATLFVDKDNRLVVLESPAQELKVIRKDLSY